MVSCNEIVREILKAAGVTVTYYHPGKVNTLPVISYYELATTTGLCYDNEERAQISSVAVDIWGRGAGECDRIAVKADKAMQDEGWRRELAMDVPPENEVYHKTMRYKKQIFFEDR